MSSLDPRALRRAFGTFITGVTVVTAIDEKGVPVGFTANSYTSVSLEPPLLLVCPSKSLSSFAVFESCRHFAVSILAEDQQGVSNIFATSTLDRFGQVKWHADERGCPLIDGAAAHFSCATYQRSEAGDHVILIGEIERFSASGAEGLGYSNGGYFSLGLERRAETLPAVGRQAFVGAVVEHEGRLLLEETARGFRPPQVAVAQGTSPLAAVESLFAERALAVELGPAYSIFENKHKGEIFTYYRATAARSEANGLGRFIPVDDLGLLTFVTSAHKTMIDRYILERRNGIFGLYVGDEALGDVHMFGEGPAA